jgi:pyruvate ferredoxin oxidoreductase gamma subunit
VKELLLAGRGGDGVVLASQILADTFARAGFWVQSFPEFKAERRGAPISAFLRWDEQPIHRRYKVHECDVLVVVSPLPPTPQQLASIRAGGVVVLNRETRFAQAGPFEVARVPASRIAQENAVVSSEGRPMGNIAVLGACVRVLLPEGLPFLEQAVTARLGSRAEPNIAAARAGFARCTRQHRLATDPHPAGGARSEGKRVPLPAYPVSSADSLANHTGGWSLDRPALHDGCTACALCALFCPEGAISKSEGVMTIDYLYCKGCGICEAVCPVRNAIAMEEVPA